jgi:adenine-specific DNA-methyltransferase
VKKYLLSFGIEKLEQTGATHNIDGKQIKARKKTNNKWFETQDSISYWEDFYQP